jgi:urease accessory protein
MAPPAWLQGHWGGVPDPEAESACRVGVLEVSRSGGKSAATRLFHQYPLRLIVPRRVKSAFPDADCIWCYSVTFGGGLVAGDRSGMSVSVADGCAAVLATQGTTKVYKHARSVSVAPRTEHSNDTITDEASRYSAGDAKTSRDTVQALAARVGAGSLLAVLPDPVQSFRDSRFRNRQRIELAPTASLALVDWVVAGRAGFEGGGAGGFTSGYGGGVAPAETFPKGPERRAMGFPILRDGDLRFPWMAARCSWSRFVWTRRGRDRAGSRDVWARRTRSPSSSSSVRGAPPPSPS